MPIKNFYGELYNKNGIFNNNSNISNFKKNITDNIDNNIKENYSSSNETLNNNELKMKLSSIENKFNDITEENINDNINENYDLNQQSMFNYSIISIIIIIIIGLVMSMIYYFKDEVLQLYNKYTSKDDDLKNEIKQLKKSLKKEKQTIKEKKKNKERINKLKEKGGIYDLQKEINNKSKYLEKKVNEDGFCFIGNDNGMRNCSEIYEGEICMSGELYPTLQHCMFPRLR